MGENNVLVVVDMQNDFIDGALGTKEAVEIVDNVVKEIRKDYAHIVVTKDSHSEDYLETEEGKNLPVKHCIVDTDGWKLNEKVQEALNEKSFDKVAIFRKLTFGSEDLVYYLKKLRTFEKFDSFTFVGLCTDICVISNALMIKAAFPEVPMYIVENATAGVTPEKKAAALEVLNSCQIYTKEV